MHLSSRRPTGRRARLGLLLPALVAVLALPAGPLAPAVAARPMTTPPRVLQGDTATHDPSLVRTSADGSRPGDQRWVVFSTGDPQVAGGTVQVRTSRDGRRWTPAGTVGTHIPAWVQSAVPGVTNLWAPDVSFHDGRWYLYYAASTFGSNRSVIGLMTTRSLDPRAPGAGWVDQGLVLQTGPDDDVNAIDPAVVTARDGSSRLAFGSFWSGIAMTSITFPSGKPVSPTPPRVALVDRHVPPNAVEGAYVVAHRGWFYLFASFDFCCRGSDSTYHVVVGRSRDVDGPYSDRTGRLLTDGGGSPFLDAAGDMRGPGGESITPDGRGHDTFAFHYYDAAASGAFSLGLARLSWRGGWPVPVDLRIRRLTKGTR